MPKHGLADVVGVLLFVEFPRMYADDDDRIVLVFLLQEFQVRHDVHAVDAAVGPEIEDNHLPFEILDGDRFFGIEPAVGAREFGAFCGAFSSAAQADGAAKHSRAARHNPIVPHECRMFCGPMVALQVCVWRSRYSRSPCASSVPAPSPPYSGERARVRGGSASCALRQTVPSPQPSLLRTGERE